MIASRPLFCVWLGITKLEWLIKSDTPHRPVPALPGTSQLKGTPFRGQIRSQPPDTTGPDWLQSTQNRRYDTLTDP